MNMNTSSADKRRSAIASNVNVPSVATGVSTEAIASGGSVSESPDVAAYGNHRPQAISDDPIDLTPRPPKPTYIPTFRELIAEYKKIAVMERVKSERPSAITVTNAETGVRAVLPEGWMDRPVFDLTRRRIDEYLVRAISKGNSPVTAWSYVLQLRAITARWTRSYYEDIGWLVPKFDLPVCHRKPPRYVRPERNILLRVRAWYESLEERLDDRDWLVGTLMLEFAMRNSDIARLKWNNFRQRDTGVQLCYTPHKTELSSGRVVCWPVHPDLWRKISRVRRKPDQDLVVPAAFEVFRRLNAELRACKIFRGCKALYELRKICIDHIYQRFGSEMASSISGDDIHTVTRYYADPSAANVRGVRIIDLI